MIRQLLGYDADTDTEYLVTIWETGHAELASRPGKGSRSIAWSPPVYLADEAAGPC